MVAVMKQQQGAGAENGKAALGLDLTQFGRGGGASSSSTATLPPPAPQPGQGQGNSGSGSRPAASMAPPPPLFMAAASSAPPASGAAPAPTSTVEPDGQTAPPAPAPAPAPGPTPPYPAPSASMMPPPPPRLKTPHPPAPAPDPTAPPPDHPHPYPHIPGLPSLSLPTGAGSRSLKAALAVTQHALLIQQMREMVQAILRIDIADMQEIACSVAENIKSYMDQQQRRAQDSATSQSLEVSEVLSIKAVLKVLEGTSFFDHEPDPCAAGAAAVLTLRLAIFGQGGGGAEPERVTALAFGSMEKVRAFHTSCLWLLLRCLRPSNCLRLLRLGQALGLEQLEDRCLLYALANLQQALGGAGREEWVQLRLEDVVALLGNSNVQLPSELEVWEAASAWISYSPPDRQHHVVYLLERCLRLQDMNLLQLQQLRQTHLVAGCPEAASLVSAAYTRQMVNSVHQSRTVDPADPGSDAALMLHHQQHQHQHQHQQHDAGAGLLTISPDEEQLMKKPRLGQAAIAAAVVGPEAVARVDGQGRGG